LTELQSTGREGLLPWRQPGSDESITWPPLHDPLGALHVQGVQVRVSAKPVWITVLLAA
jgi:hypothetical protein